jgi:predicted ATPase/class 3 adenylate cyclase
VSVRQLPTGTVTLLFTDIEGSTRLLQELGSDRYVWALEEHRRLLREAFARHGGVEVELQGDSFHYVFANASDAVRAAAAGQRALVEHEWPDAAIRVRMGIHTGAPVVSGNLYAGLDVHRAARLMSAGHGGQVLVSQATRDLADVGLELRDLGSHRLKDLSAPERIFQLGDGNFPALKSLNQSNLPLQPTALVGRKRELREVHELLRSSRLLTLTGAGGSGKTRLALQAGAELVDEFPDGVWFVSLAALTNLQLVEPTVAHALGARDDLAAFLSVKKLLLLLDNLEQLLPDVAVIVAALFEAPDVKVLATSRERLAVSAEQEYAVPTLGREEAVELFVRRARQLKPTFEPDENVTEIADRLDGLPLALELAAARLKMLTPRQILERLSHSLELLTLGSRDLPARQQTLRATIEWSYGLLSEDEQPLLARLAVFSGSFDVDAAVAVADAEVELLQALVDKSLLQYADGRFVMLETIREFAFEHLRSGRNAAEVRDRHAAHFAALAERLDLASRTEDHGDAYHELDLEIANLRAAIGWSREGGRSELLLRFATALWRFWSVRGYVAEGKVALEEALAAREERPARALLGLCTMRLHSGASADEVIPDAEAVVEATELLNDDFSRAQAWNLIGKLKGSFLGELGPAEQAFERALTYADRGNYHTERAESIWGLTLSALAGPMPVPAAITRAEQLIRLTDEPETHAFCLSALGALEAMRGRFDVARQLLGEGTAIFEQLELNVWAANNAQLSFVVEMLGGEPRAAAQALRASFDRLAEMGEQGFLSTIAGYLAHALHETGDDTEAERFSRASEQAAAADDMFSQVLWRSARAKILAKRGEGSRAGMLAREAVQLVDRTDLLDAQGNALLDLAVVLGRADQLQEARATAEEAARRFDAKGNLVSLERATDLAGALTATVR